MPGVKIEKTSHPEYGACIRLSNEKAILYITLDYGPRIIHYSLGDGPNAMFFNRDPDYLKNGEEFDKFFYPGAFWNIYGGNRLWVAPHSFPQAFYPDNGPVDFEIVEGGARFTPQPRTETRVQIRTNVRLDPFSSRVSIDHSVENMSSVPMKMAAWSITSVDGGGLEIIPQAERQTGVLPNRHISLWPYSDMRDARIAWGKRFISLKHDAHAKKQIKIGTNDEEGWACYLNKGQCFLLGYEHDREAEYADFGVSYETFSDDRMVEMETMSPLKLVAPGESVKHGETWRLFPIGESPDVGDMPDVGDEDGMAAFVDSVFSNFNDSRPRG